MVGLDGKAGSVNIDGFGGYEVARYKMVSVEARPGLRYQRTSLHGTVEVAGATVKPPTSVSASLDALAGARVFVQPLAWLSFAGAADVGLVGDSASTWSASLDATVRIKAHVLLSLGWRTLTQESTSVQMVMHGPRAAVQLLF